MLSKQAITESANFQNGDCLVRYFDHQIRPGGAFQAILENDLAGVFRRGDSTTIRDLKQIMSWLYNYAPASRYGSIEAVQNHLSGNLV